MTASKLPNPEEIVPLTSILFPLILQSFAYALIVVFKELELLSAKSIRPCHTLFKVSCISL